MKKIETFLSPNKNISHQFHVNFTPTSTQFFILTSSRGIIPKMKEVTIMFFGLEWYWWLIILAALIISIPCKVKFMKWWSKRRQKKEQYGKWGDDE